VRTSVPEGVGLAVAAIVLVVSLVVVATRSPSKTSSDGAMSTATPAPSVTEGPSSATPASSAAHAANSAAPTRAPAAATTTAAPVRAGAAVPPKPGRYEYTETDSSGPKTSTLDITSHGGGKQTENTDSGSAIDEVEWRPDGKYELATTFSFQAGSFRCDWNPDFVQYKFPLRRGSSWKVLTSCHPNAQSTITLSGSSRVSGQQRMTVGGVTVDTWILLTDAKITFSGNGTSFSESLQDEDHFAPRYGITVREIQTTTDTDPSGQQTHNKTTRELKSLKPTVQA
jgi:hypothetical protein